MVVVTDTVEAVAAGARASSRRRAAGRDSRLHHVDQAADHVAARADRGMRDVRRGWWRPGADAIDGSCLGRRACVRGRQRAQPRARSRHRPPHGTADRVASGRRRPDPAARAPSCLPLVAVRAVVRGAGGVRESAGGRARAQRRRVLRGRVHAAAEADDRRRTSSSAARPGAFPPVAGWAAACGRLGLGALLLFAIVLLWTPPHFWALALLIAPGYKAAGVPMMPVVRGGPDHRASRCCTRSCWWQ